MKLWFCMLKPFMMNMYHYLLLEEFCVAFADKVDFIPLIADDIIQIFQAHLTHNPRFVS